MKQDFSAAEAILDRALREFSCVSGTVHRTRDRRGKDEGTLELVACRGIPEMLMPKISEIPFGKGIAGVAAATQGPVELCNLQEDLGGVAKVDARKTGVAGSLAVPVFSADGTQVLGTLGVGKREPHDFTEQEKQRLAGLAGELADHWGNSMASSAAGFRQAVCRWCFDDLTLNELCVAAKECGIEGIDLVTADEWAVVRGHGLEVSMGTLPFIDGIGTIENAFNRPGLHDALEKLYLRQIDLAAEAGIAKLICFSGNRGGMDLETGLENCAAGLGRLVAHAERKGVTLVMELLNSKVDHPDYMADHSDWGAALVEKVGSENFKLLYDIYHMQVMEGDVIATIQRHHRAIAHFHTAGVPGRHELDERQELNYPAICRAIQATGFTGFVAHEFVPRRRADGLANLAAAVQLCAC